MSGTAYFYAGVYQTGVFYTTDAAGQWTNLNAKGIGLPSHTAGTTTEPDGNFDALLVDFCPRNPKRAYVWMVKRSCDSSGICNQITAGLYTTSSALSSWTPVAMGSPPNPGQQ
jgi:hypothetical protein